MFRVTARKNQWGEVEEWICNTCRFDKKKTSDWIIEGPTVVNRHSVISANHYLKETKKPPEFLPKLMGGRNPRLLMPIHNVSDVNRPEIELSKIEGPPTSDVFEEGEEKAG